MQIVADLHVHSRFSRACSREMEIERLAWWAKRKGIDLLGTGDFTHPIYLTALRQQLEPAEAGLFRLRAGERGVRFMLTAEVTNIFRHAGRLRKTHTLLFAPSFAAVDRLTARLAKHGTLALDGRPTLTCTARELLTIVRETAPECEVIPAHVWTPWFSVLGAFSGFDSLAECYGEETQYIRAVETGLSSDPAMNWRLSALDTVALISNSDAHSPPKLGREANVLDCELSYEAVVGALTSRDPTRFLYTIEFFPEGGKYHFDGHRHCQTRFSPAETRQANGLCPVCGKPLTIGVLHRIDALADRPAGFIPPHAIPARHLLPLQEILAVVLQQRPETKKVMAAYHRLVDRYGPELRLLLDLPEEELTTLTPPGVGHAILQVRRGQVEITPGYDGTYGKIGF
ncbi:MAG: endonuclease Q family protein [Candidatus Binatia bacterium]|nr:endonuclease Q family protein [Candidatus Binatia bacterium]